MSLSSEFDIDLQNKAEEVAELTGGNQHTEAYIAICEFLKLDDLVRDLNIIKAKQAKVGELLNGDYALRSEIYQMMCKQGRKLLGVETYDKYFYSNT